jgi:hypothetical protein
MYVCPKCGFSGHDPDTCERCGIIFARMHTIMESRPAALADLALLRPAPAPSGSAEMKTVVDMPRAVVPEPTMRLAPPGDSAVSPPSRASHTIARAFPGAQSFGGAGRSPELTPGLRLQRELTLVPRVPPPTLAPSRRLGLLLGVLVVCCALWGLSSWRDARAKSFRTSVTGIDGPADDEYFDIRAAQLIEDAKSQLRTFRDLPATTKAQKDIWERVRHLKTRLPASSLSEARKEAVGSALDEVVRFLKEDVGGVLASEKARAATPPDPASVSVDPSSTKPAPPAKRKRINQAALDHAVDLLAHLPP